MHSIESIAAEIVRREGGYVNDPADPGGATNYGVTIHTMRRLGLDLTGNGTIDEHDVRSLTANQAADVFVLHYFKKPRLDLLPEPIQPTVFDMQVNAGSSAIRILQRLLGRFGFRLKEDGMIGPITVKAAHEAMELAPDHLVCAYGIERRNYYYRLGDQRPPLRKFACRSDGGKGGWIARAEEFVQARFHFTRAQHDERVRGW